jgi:heterodisulfide reductase subunit B
MTTDAPLRDIAFFPGCSLATSAKENYESMRGFCRALGYNLAEIPDWNCCGTSSAHCVDPELAFDLASRNLSLVPSGSRLLVACPTCYKQLKKTHRHCLRDESFRRRYERNWSRELDPDLEIVPFLQFLAEHDLTGLFGTQNHTLKGLRTVPYYGCMLARPPVLSRDGSDSGIMESVLENLGATTLLWSYASHCCGTFLSISRPEIATPRVNAIMENAVREGAECIVTACSMCHLNMEIRCTSQEKLPIFHFSELLSLASGAGGERDWFSRHLIDPRPLLEGRELL